MSRTTNFVDAMLAPTQPAAHEKPVVLPRIPENPPREYVRNEQGQFHKVTTIPGKRRRGIQ
jgi:hypothetical protein